MAIKAPSHPRTILSEINVTPMVDVALTLLIVFMITAPLLQQGLPVNLPEASAPAIKRSQQDVILTVQNDGRIYMGDDRDEIPIEEVQGRLAAIFSQRQQKDLFIKADTDLRYGTVIKVMSIAKKSGVDRIGMITQPETKLN